MGGSTPKDPPQSQFTFTPAPAQAQNNAQNGLPTAGTLVSSGGTGGLGGGSHHGGSQAGTMGGNGAYTGTVLGGTF
jgi:hypothetical protein